MEKSIENEKLGKKLVELLEHLRVNINNSTIDTQQIEAKIYELLIRYNGIEWLTSIDKDAFMGKLEQHKNDLKIQKIKILLDILKKVELLNLKRLDSNH